VDDALNILKFTNKEAAGWLEKLVLSAVSNWANASAELSPEDYKLFIKTAFVDGGPVLKRFRPAPHGRANRIRKRMNHVTLIVENKVKIEE
jgi:large subunit ribosomal protein L22